MEKNNAQDAHQNNLKVYYDTLISHKLENQKEYQKVILGLSGGALTVSLTFSDNIVSQTNSIFNIILVVGWLLLLITVLMQVYYYKKVTISSNELIDKIYKVLYSNEGESEESIFSVYKVKVRELDFLNKISIITMFSGLSLISIFFSINLLLKTTNDPLPEKTTPPVQVNRSENVLPQINIENNPVFINNNCKSDTTIIKKYYNCKPKSKKPC